MLRVIKEKAMACLQFLSFAPKLTAEKKINIVETDFDIMSL